MTGQDACVGRESATTATIRVTRDRTGSNARFRAFRVIVDDQEVGRVRRGETCEVSVAPGEHRVRLRIDRAGSPEWGVSLAAGETGEFRCRPASGGGALRQLRRLGIERDEYIELSPIE